MHSKVKQLEHDQALAALRQIRCGIEKEGLRVNPQGGISHQAHPAALGSALCNRYITTDYSEALLEFVTPVFSDASAALDFLADLHAFSYRHLAGELIWPGCMPCALEGDQDVPIAHYGPSNLGQLKHIYRVGLGHRYGRIMQCIAGIHYNFSMPESFWPLYADLKGWKEPQNLIELRSRAYFCLIGNFHRYAWLLLYLFGASPALDRSFLVHSPQQLSPLAQRSLYLPHATSLRMSDLGYHNNAQASLVVNFSSLDGYIHSLHQALATVHPPYQNIGVKVEGRYRQLNHNLLQIENEFYSHIRPKCVTQAGERPLQALQRRGVEYVEVRNLDINPLLPLGLDTAQTYFIDAFLLTCLLSDGCQLSPLEGCQVNFNHQQIANFGREKKINLFHQGLPIEREHIGDRILELIEPVAALLDRAHQSDRYHRAWQQQKDKIHDSSLTPSAQLLEQLQQNNLDYLQLMLQLAAQHRQHFHQISSPQREQELTQEASVSWTQQQRIEQQEQLDFDTFYQNYLEISLPRKEVPPPEPG